MEHSKFLNNLLLRSFHTIHTHRRRISCKKERRAFRPPVAWINWIKWYERIHARKGNWLCQSSVRLNPPEGPPEKLKNGTRREQNNPLEGQAATATYLKG